MGVKDIPDDDFTMSDSEFNSSIVNGLRETSDVVMSAHGKMCMRMYNHRVHAPAFAKLSIPLSSSKTSLESC